jgi:CheY-like chemotaxis protein
MTTSAFAPLSAPLPAELKKKRVLLVDTSSAKRDLRAEALRKLGMDVDCAADISEARSWWRVDLYHLVLIHVENNASQRDGFCQDIRRTSPRQQVAFLVGKPAYLADAPKEDLAASLVGSQDGALAEDARALPADLADLPPLRWGILEASKRISEVRSVSIARTRAMRERPAPVRDSEVRPSKRIAPSATLDDLLREEMQ